MRDAAEFGTAGVERIKGVFRTGPESWLLVQSHGETVRAVESQWRRDSRVEVQLAPGVVPDWSSWDARWAAAVSVR